MANIERKLGGEGGKNRIPHTEPNPVEKHGWF